MTVSTKSIILYGVDSPGWVKIGKDISDLLTDAGVIKTSDTGQIDWSSVTRPSSQGILVGYEIRQIPTSIGSLFMKITYGTGLSSSNNYGFGITFGTGSDGSGNIIGAFGSELWASPGGSSAWTITYPLPCYASSWDGGFALVLAPAANNIIYRTVIVFDTACDDTGAKTDKGYLWLMNNTAGTRVQAYGWSSLFSTRALFETFPARLPWHYWNVLPSSIKNNKRMYSVVRHLFPEPAWHPNLLIGNSPDCPAGAEFYATVLGVRRKYLSVGATHGGFNGNIISANNDFTASLCFLWE